MKQNPEMIVLARQYRGLSQYELAAGIGMSATNLSKLERGAISSIPATWLNIAEQTMLPKQFFTQESQPVDKGMIFRKREKVPARILDSIVARGRLVHGHLKFIADAMQLANPGLPAWQENPAALAAELAESWNLGFPVKQLMRSIENNGIAVMQWDFGTERIDSFSLHGPGTHPLICLNNKLTGDRQRFSLAYELGRILKHEDANAFAAALLMPEGKVRPAFENGITIALLEQLKQQWQLSMISILYRADDLGFLTANQKRYLLQQFNELGIRRHEPARLNVKPETPTLMRHLLGRYAAKTRSGATVMAAMLCLHLGEYMEMYG